MLLAGTVAAADPVDKPAPRRVPGFDVNALDQSVNACTDFYQFACGGWISRNPVPADRARWGRFDELTERNQAALRAILDKAASSAADRQIGDYYTACMDEKGIEALGLRPVKATLDRIASLKTRASWPARSLACTRRASTCCSDSARSRTSRTRPR